MFPETSVARIGRIPFENEADNMLGTLDSGAISGEIQDHYSMRWILWRYLRYSQACPPAECIRRTVTFVSLNPSTADASKDDPTMRKILGFTKRWGLWRVIVVNLWAYRATKPRDLWSELDWLDSNPCQVPGLNDLSCVDDYIEYAALNSAIVIAAWGAGVPAKHSCRIDDVRDLLNDVQARNGIPISCLGRTKGGEPRHPLMLPYSTELEPYLW